VSPIASERGDARRPAPMPWSGVNYALLSLGIFVAYFAAYFALGGRDLLPALGAYMLLGAVVELSVAAFIAYERVTPRSYWGAQCRDGWVRNLGALAMGAFFLARPRDPILEWTLAALAVVLMLGGTIHARRRRRHAH